MTAATRRALEAVRDEMQAEVRWNSSYRTVPVPLYLVQKWTRQLDALLTEQNLSASSGVVESADGRREDQPSGLRPA